MRKQAGFTIISVMIALVLVAVGLGALSRAGFEGQRAQTTAATRTTALDIARTYMEDLRSRDPAGLVSEAPVAVNDMGQPDPAGTYARQVTIDSPASNLKQLTVRVDGPHLRNPVVLVTLAYIPRI